MADTRFFQYLEAAFRYRLYDPTGQTATFNTHFNRFGYSLTYKKVFEYARKVLPPFYRSSAEFPDTEEGNLLLAKTVLEKLDRHQDKELENIFRQNTISQENSFIIEQAQAESQAVEPQTVPVNTMTGSAGDVPFRMPSAPSFPSASMPTFMGQQPSQPISGMEGGTGQGTAVTNKRFNFSSLKPSASLVMKNIQNFAFPAKIPVRNTLQGVASGLGGIAKGGLQAAAPALGRAFHTGLNGAELLSRPRGIGGGKLGSLSRSSNKLALIGVGSLLVSVLLAGLVGLFVANTSSTSPSPSVSPGASPTSAPIPPVVPPTIPGAGLNYTLPLKETAAQVVDIRNKIKEAFPAAKLEYWDVIVEKSKVAGWNPALLLALWIEETGASQATLAANGGGGISFQGNLSTGHLGCAPGEDQTIEESLTCVFKMGARNNFTNDQFPQFMAQYSGGPADDPFSNNPNFTTNFRLWYSQLVPAGIGAITAIATPEGKVMISCPINEGAITYGSKEVGGHCSSTYQFDCIQPGQVGYTGRETAVDVRGSDRTVYLPYLSGNTVNWTIEESGTQINNSEGGGIAVGATALMNGKQYRIRFVHIESTALRVGQTVRSATPVGQHVIPSAERMSFANHVHITIQEDGIYKPADLYFNLCR